MTEPVYPMIAKTMRGLEELLAAELDAIGARRTAVQPRAVVFEGDTETMYRANVESRLALRVLKPVRTFYINSQDEFYEKMRAYDWSQHMGNDTSFAVDTTVFSDLFQNSQFVAYRTKDAIVDYFRDRTGGRPNVDIKFPAIRFHVRLERKLVTVSLDSSGQSLHRRGYRSRADRAPISEVLAAGLILLSGWDRRGTFVDPMCGSGTIAIEAAMIARNVAPGLIRERFGFMNWPDYDAALFRRVREAAKGRAHQRPARGVFRPVVAADLSAKVIDIAKENVRRAGLPAEAVEFHQSAFENFEPPPGPGVVVMNPPYGQRLKKVDIDRFYKHLGDKLKHSYDQYDAWILSSNKEALKAVHLKASKRITLYNGPLECSYRKFEIYAPSPAEDEVQE